MNLGFVDRATVLHEFGHAIGLIHEHQSPFKGGFQWNREEVRVHVGREVEELEQCTFDILYMVHHVTLHYTAFIILCYIIIMLHYVMLYYIMLHHITLFTPHYITCMLHQVIKALSGPPNYWDMDRIENNMFKKYKRKDLDGTLYDSKSIMHYA